MKLNQSDSQITIQQSGIGQVVVGALFIIVGGGMSFVALTSPAAPAWVSLLGLGFIVVGAFIALMAKNTTTEIVKKGNLTVNQKRLLFGAANEQAFPVERIVGVRLVTQLESDSSSDSSSGNNRTSRLTLLLDDNTLVEIAKKTQNSASVNGISLNAVRQAPLSKEASIIAEFLSIDLDASDTSTLTGAIKSIKSALSEQGHDLKKKQ